MNAKLTDEAVASLPLHAGRVELLEEIMSTPVLDDRPVRPDRAPASRRTAWLVPAAAAAVLALIGGCAWLVAGGATRDAGVAGGSDGAYRAILVAPGWTVANVYADDASGELTYAKGVQRFEISWSPAAEYDGYVEDRRHITETPTDGRPVEVLGRGALMWTYDGADPTAIREIEDGHFLELRGKSMSTAAYLRLLHDVRLVDRGDFEAAMPSSYVDGSARQLAVDRVLDDISDYVDPLIPPGSLRSGFSSDEDDLDLLGAEVARDVACEWLTEYVDAHRVGDQARMGKAAAVLGTSHDWPTLAEMTPTDGYPTRIWQYADRVVAGHVPTGYGRVLGCEG